MAPRTSDYLDPIEALDAMKRMREAKKRITKFRRAASARPARPEIYECKCGAQVFKAWTANRSKEAVVLEWAEHDEAIDAVFGWEVQLELAPNGAGTDFEWVCMAVRHFGDEEDSDAITWEPVAQDYESPRYAVHRHTKAAPRATTSTAQTQEEDEKALTRAWQGLREVEAGGQQAWALMRGRLWRPAPEPPQEALEESREGSDVDPQPAAARECPAAQGCRSSQLPLLPAAALGIHARTVCASQDGPSAGATLHS